MESGRPPTPTKEALALYGSLGNGARFSDEEDEFFGPPAPSDKNKKKANKTMEQLEATASWRKLPAQLKVDDENAQKKRAKELQASIDADDIPQPILEETFRLSMVDEDGKQISVKSISKTFVDVNGDKHDTREAAEEVNLKKISDHKKGQMVDEPTSQTLEGGNQSPKIEPEPSDFTLVCRPKRQGRLSL
ncbi:hypothetical protein EAF04_003737 [Stromatinia cepivora]|nr:hypothetical protein EAF04_003737 [Stromatinia cepivora]